MVWPEEYPDARPARPRRAFSLLELTLVVTIIGLLSGAAISRFGAATLSTTEGEGFARRLVLDLRQARRRAITTGVDHYVQLHRDAGVVTGFSLHQSGGAQADNLRSVPAGVTVNSAADVWTFDFDGALSAGGASSTLTLVGANHQWVVTCYHATGMVQLVKQPL